MVLFWGRVERRRRRRHQAVAAVRVKGSRERRGEAAFNIAIFTATSCAALRVFWLRIKAKQCLSSRNALRVLSHTTGEKGGGMFGGGGRRKTARPCVLCVMVVGARKRVGGQAVLQCWGVCVRAVPPGSAPLRRRRRWCRTRNSDGAATKRQTTRGGWRGAAPWELCYACMSRAPGRDQTVLQVFCACVIKI